MDFPICASLTEPLETVPSRELLLLIRTHSYPPGQLVRCLEIVRDRVALPDTRRLHIPRALLLPYCLPLLRLALRPDALRLVLVLCFDLPRDLCTLLIPYLTKHKRRTG